VSLQLESNGTASGNDGCLQYTAQWSMSGSNFSFSNVSEVAGVTNCLPDAATQASNYLDSLRRVYSYLIDGSGNLVYYDSNGSEILRYK
jgi:heat shock protein HslJ